MAGVRTLQAKFSPGTTRSSKFVPEAQSLPGPSERITVLHSATLTSAWLTEDGWARRQGEADCPTLDPALGDGAELQVLLEDWGQLSAKQQSSTCLPLPLLLPLPPGSLLK